MACLKTRDYLLSFKNKQSTVVQTSLFKYKYFFLKTMTQMKKIIADLKKKYFLDKNPPFLVKDLIFSIIYIKYTDN